MNTSKAINLEPSTRAFEFESFGVFVRVESDQPDMVDEGETVARRALLNDIRPVGTAKIDHVFKLQRTKGGTFILIQNGKRIASGRSRMKFFKFFDGILRVSIGEYAPHRVFMHAGVVGWKGNGIIMPADTFQGKTTLVAELVRSGASYYSDEFAILDKKGLVHPFHRPLAMRAREGKYREWKLTPEQLGGTYGHDPLPVGLVLLTGYKPGARWSPRILTAGEGAMRMMPYALSLRYRPDFAMQVLNYVASRAIIASSLRGNAENFAKTLLNFVDKHGF